jgi:hypothetical protein
LALDELAVLHILEIVNEFFGQIMPKFAKSGSNSIGWGRRNQTLVTSQTFIVSLACYFGDLIHETPPHIGVTRHITFAAAVRRSSFVPDMWSLAAHGGR